MWFPKSRVKNLLEKEDEEQTYTNDKGQEATLSSSYYGGKQGLSPDHYVHIKGMKTTVHSTKEKAQKKLALYGYKPKE